MTLTDLYHNKFCYVCIDESSCYATENLFQQTNSLECANGKFGEKWDGCIDQGSVRVRCSKGTLPCNELATNGKEFSCRPSCENYGGDKKCSLNE